jgi:hypothetical protein
MLLQRPYTELLIGEVATYGRHGYEILRLSNMTRFNY